MIRFFRFFLALAVAMISLPGCKTTAPVVNGLGPAEVSRLNAIRAGEIAAEQPGDYFIGRRYVLNHVRFWGYLRHPNQPWTTSKLVIMNEKRRRVPDRLPEFGDGRIHGFDHNHEYLVRGHYTGRIVYDPNSNLQLPEFEPSGFELLSQDPGFIFNPGERYDPTRLPADLHQ